MWFFLNGANTWSQLGTEGILKHRRHSQPLCGDYLTLPLASLPAKRDLWISATVMAIQNK